MRIYAVTPIHVSDDDLAYRQQRYDTLAPRGVSVKVANLSSDAPRLLETEADISESERFVAETLAGAPEDFDALMPDCVLDPGVEDLIALGTRPVFGLLQLNLGWAVASGIRLSAATRNEPIAAELTRRVKVYGLQDVWGGTEALDMEGDVLFHHDRWISALSVAAQGSGQRGASAMLNGCSAIGLPPGLETAIPITDPVAIALRMIPAVARSSGTGQ